MVEEIKAVDCLIFIPRRLSVTNQEAVEKERKAGRGGLLDLFPGILEREKDTTPDELVAEMNQAGVEKGLLNMRTPEDKDWIMEAINTYPDMFIFAGVPINPIANKIMDEVRRVENLINACHLQSIRISGWRLGVPCTDHRLFPIYSLAIEYNIKVSITIGYPGPAGLARTQSPLYVDEVCYLFPELTIIQSHPGHPWMEEAIHNVIKYPNCYLKTNGYRPKYLPHDFIQHLNTRAQDKILWASEYPTIGFETSLDDVKRLPLRDHVRRKYLRENALNIFRF